MGVTKRNIPYNFQRFKLPQTSIRQGDGFLNKFNDFEFTLLVVIFYNIFGPMEEVYLLQKKSFDIIFYILKLKIRQTHT